MLGQAALGIIHVHRAINREDGKLNPTEAPDDSQPNWLACHCSK